MNQRVALAVVISILILVGYSYLFPKPKPTQAELDAIAAGETDGEPTADGDKPPADPKDSVEKIDPSEAGQAAGEPNPAAPPTENVPLAEHRLANDLLAITVDNQPGGLITAVEPLADQFHDKAEDRGIDFLMLDGARTLEFGFVAADTDFKWSRIPGQLRITGDRSVELVRRQGDIEVVESLTLLDGYEAQYAVVVKNHGAGQQVHRIEIGTRMGMSADQSRYDIHRALCRTPEAEGGGCSFRNGPLKDFDFDDVEDENEHVTGKLDWWALDSKYFVQALVPSEQLAGCVVSSDDDGTAIINTGLGGEVELGPGEQKRYEFGLYVGAKVDSMLQDFPVSESLSAVPEATDLTEAIDWGWFGGLSKFLGTMMLSLLRWFYSLTGVWGVAIIMLTIVIKLTLLPLTIKQYSSMRKMKELQPEMEKIREKYGDDKVKQQQEMQALFQRTGINPLAGCMPMVLQFPVWIALYAMLGAVVDLYHETFLWLPDLTQPDPLYILPIAMGGLMFIQTRINPTAGDAQQAKMMQWMMPGIFVVMMLFLPSGLGIYIFANIVLSLIQSFVQLRMKGTDAGAAAGTTDTAKPAAKGTSGKRK
ncbi:Membrane protein insertase YidC [Enhygromyxa salina]|uniref:Membrane protein insertase YidC n=2 Tax=Enhygromyxa salina TaxID=215803 RepID=A0A2S9XS49_9BACT|nr:Membrane protein insertase YidC [Enhygromyxa salina]